MSRSRPATVRVGCSGWHYAGWAGVFYDATLPKSKWLEAYARVFDTVELNNSFYRLPTAPQFRRWREAVPPGFLFAVKASRYLTHLKRLRDPAAPLDLLIARARELGPALGPLLYQLPPRWAPDDERLRTFVAALPKAVGSRKTRLTLQHVVEFRDARSYRTATIDLLRSHDVALCVHDMSGSESPRTVTSRRAYIRFHGFGARYGGSYPTSCLKSWADWITAVRDEGIEVFAYFNNDVDGHAVRDANRLKSLL